MIHYHGTPITPQDKLLQLAGRNFCVSFAAGYQVVACHEIGQSVMLDNGAFSFWRDKERPHPGWPAFYDWAEPWLHYQTTWAVIPDVIDGSEADNDRLVSEWLIRGLPRGAPVWHMHESLDRLRRLCDVWPRVCVGSSAQFAQVGSGHWHRRMEQAMNAVCGNGPVPVWLHMLRGMSLSGSAYPFASVDSTDVAQNHNRGLRGRSSPVSMADRWDGVQCPAVWEFREQLELVEGGRV